MTKLKSIVLGAMALAAVTGTATFAKVTKVEIRDDGVMEVTMECVGHSDGTITC